MIEITDDLTVPIKLDHGLFPPDPIDDGADPCPRPRARGWISGAHPVDLFCAVADLTTDPEEHPISR